MAELEEEERRVEDELQAVSPPPSRRHETEVRYASSTSLGWGFGGTYNRECASFFCFYCLMLCISVKLSVQCFFPLLTKPQLKELADNLLYSGQYVRVRMLERGTVTRVCVSSHVMSRGNREYCASIIYSSACVHGL